MILSCITMLIDHIGCVFFPDSVIWRVIGRLAMPLYAYFIAAGYKYTSDLGRYIRRIALMAVISQIPFMFLFDMKMLNVCFAWLLSLLIIYGIDRKNYRVLTLGLAVTGAILLTISVDYSFYGILLPIMFYFRNKTNVFYKDLVMFFGIIVFALPFRNACQCVAALDVPIILLAEKYNQTRAGNKIIKRCYQWFYPAHMVVLLIIKKIVLPN